MEICIIRNNVVPLQCSNKDNINMKKALHNKRVSQQEDELIEAIRNLRAAYPNGYEDLKEYALYLFDELTTLPLQD